MRHPRCFAVLKWLGVGLISSCVAIPTAIAAVGGTYPAVKDWGQQQWDVWALYLMTPLAFFAFVVFILLFISVLAYCGTGPDQNDQMARIANALESLTVKMGGEAPGAKPVQPDNAMHAHVTATSTITGRLDAVEQDSDTANFTGTTGMVGLYVGNIIVAAGSLNEGRLDIAIRGFNGTNEAVSITEVSGHIRAGVGNKRDDTNLPLPELQGAARVDPHGEFIILLRQSMPSGVVADFLGAWSKGENASLDLRELVIRTVAIDQSEKSARLPLWDGVNLRRVDDIATNRNTILSVGTAIASSNAFGVGIGKRNGDGT